MLIFKNRLRSHQHIKSGTSWLARRGTASGDAGAVLYDANGNEIRSRNPGDGLAGERSLDVLSHVLGHNGTNWDRWRNNEMLTALLPNAARTVTEVSALQTNFNARGLFLFIVVDTIVATPSVTPVVHARQDTNGAYETIWQAPAAITAPGSYTYMLYPGVASGGGTSLTAMASMIIPRKWRLQMTHNDPDSITYGVDAFYIV